jgi:hypothetical protein
MSTRLALSPIHRDMNRSDHRLLWNAILNWSALLR